MGSRERLLAAAGIDGIEKEENLWQPLTGFQDSRPIEEASSTTLARSRCQRPSNWQPRTGFQDSRPSRGSEFHGPSSKQVPGFQGFQDSRIPGPLENRVPSLKLEAGAKSLGSHFLKRPWNPEILESCLSGCQRPSNWQPRTGFQDSMPFLLSRKRVPRP